MEGGGIGCDHEKECETDAEGDGREGRRDRHKLSAALEALSDTHTHTAKKKLCAESYEGILTLWASVDSGKKEHLKGKTKRKLSPSSIFDAS